MATTARPLQAEAAPARRETIVVVGNGMVGFKLLDLLATSGATDRHRVIVFGEEPVPAYDRVHLTDYLAHSSIDRMLLAPRSWYGERHIELHTGDPIVAIDPAARRVTSKKERSVRYDRLILATGSAPFVPPIPGGNEPGVMVFRTLRDLDAMRRAAHAAKRAIVIGGGLLGLEAARSLQEIVSTVEVVEAAKQLLPRQLDPPSAELLRRRIEQLGLRVHAGCAITAIRRVDGEGEGGRLVIERRDDAPLSADLVVVAAGIRPRDDLALLARLKVAPEGGVVVDDQLATSDPRILAIGECARHRGVVHGFVAPGYEMARVVAERLSGIPSRYDPGDLSCRLKLVGIDVAVVGDPKREGRRIVFESGDVRRTLVVRDSRIVAAYGVGVWPELPEVARLVEGRRDLAVRRVERFMRRGTLFGGTNPPVATWPDAALVCHCVRVSRGTLRCAFDRGARSVDALSAETGAGKVCGSCRPLLADLCGAPARRGRGTLLAGLSIVTLLACAAFVIAGPIPYAASAEGLYASVAYLWRDASFKQLSGFALVGASLATLILPLARRARGANVSRHRAIHAAAGVLAAALAALHTGLHLGHNLNRALSITFLVALASGGLTGAVTAIAERLRRPTLAPKRWLRVLHLVIVWLLPTLIAFHVLSVYRY